MARCADRDSLLLWQSQHMRVPPSFGDLRGRPIRVLWYYAILCALLGGLPVIARRARVK